MLIRFGAMGPDDYLSGWQATPITCREAARRAAKPAIKTDHAEAAGLMSSRAVEARIMVIRFPGENSTAKGRKTEVVWHEHYLDLTPQQFGYAVRESLATGVLDVRPDMLKYWREQHTRRLAFVAQTPSPYANGP